MDFDKDFTDSYLTSSSAKVHYMHHAGDGITVIFIHGLGANARTWKRLVGYLPSNWNIYLIDLFGHGKSDAPKATYTIALQSRIIDDLVKQEKLSDYTLFGHSYGGWIACFYAQSHEYNGKLVIEDSAGFAEFIKKREEEDPLYKENLYKKALLLGPDQDAVRSIVDSFDDNEELTSESLGKIENGTLVLWGKDDDTVDVKYAKIFAKSIRNSKLEIIDLGEHTPHYIRPQAVARSLVAFLDQDQSVHLF